MNTENTTKPSEGPSEQAIPAGDSGNSPFKFSEEKDPLYIRVAPPLMHSPTVVFEYPTYHPSNIIYR
jgi:hypothetical protein